MKVLLIITTLFTLTGVISATITDTSCSQKKSETKEIKYQVNGWLENKDDKITITILNYQELENVAVKSNTPNILSVESPDENGIITVTALVNENTGNISITAKDSKEVKITLAIIKRIHIEAALDSPEVWEGETTTLRIKNISELQEPEINNYSPENIELSEYDLVQGTVKVKTLHQGTSGFIAINAKNAWGETLVGILARFNKTISAESPVSVRVGRTTSLTINNFNEFVGFNLQIFSDPTGFIELGEIDDQGKVLITGLKVGLTTIKITADHTDPWSVDFQVNA